MVGLATLALPAVIFFFVDGPGTPKSLLPSAPITCGQGDSVELIGLNKDIQGGVAAEARDGCRLKIIGGVYRGKIAVRATGRAIVTIEGAALEGAEAAVVTDGSSKVTLTQCSVKAPVAVRASEQAFVILELGQVVGTTAAIEARGRARVDVKGTVVSGKSVNDPAARIVLER